MNYYNNQQQSQAPPQGNPTPGGGPTPPPKKTRKVTPPDIRAGRKIQKEFAGLTPAEQNARKIASATEAFTENMHRNPFTSEGIFKHIGRTVGGGRMAAGAALGAGAAAVGMAGYSVLGLANPQGTEINNPIATLGKGIVLGGALGLAGEAAASVGKMEAAGFKNAGRAVKMAESMAKTVGTSKIKAGVGVGAAIAVAVGAGSFNMTRRSNGVF
jgi:hypothetical protein